MYCILTRLKCNQKGMLKGFLCFVLVCLPACVHSLLCGEKKKPTPEGYPFILISLMKFVEGDGQRAFLFLSGRRSCASDYKIPAFLHQTGGQRIQESTADSSTSSKQPCQNNCVMYAKLFTCTQATACLLLCLLVHICENFKVEEKCSPTIHPPS